MFTDKEFSDAVQDYHAALDALNYVEPEFFDAANARVTECKCRLEAILRFRKKAALPNSAKEGTA